MLSGILREWCIMHLSLSILRLALQQNPESILPIYKCIHFTNTQSLLITVSKSSSLPQWYMICVQRWCNTKYCNIFSLKWDGWAKWVDSNYFYLLGKYTAKFTGTYCAIKLITYTFLSDYGKQLLQVMKTL